MRKFLIKVNNCQYEVEVEEIRDDSVSIADDTVHPAKIADDSVQNSKAADKEVHHSKAEPVQNATVMASAKENIGKASSIGGHIGNTKITAPMPGTVLKVPVSLGTAVKKGQVLLLLEAMKMENEITAPADGVILSINVAEGNSINAGDLLISLD